MPTQVMIIAGNVTLKAELFDTACAKAIAKKLPIEARPGEWGDEFYFEIPVTMSLDETASTKVKIGDIGYWPPGRAMAIFFGPTPMSTGSDPVPASAVNLVGKIIDDAILLKKAKGASKISIAGL
ncbi:MAG TPA: cyclophilin-like fold protein [Syntrophales bacterium]|nr:cyclophilin-like fold protein [Syntrophales bacterium]